MSGTEQWVRPELIDLGPASAAAVGDSTDPDGGGLS